MPYDDDDDDDLNYSVSKAHNYVFKSLCHTWYSTDK